jgi:hypothetical protein
VIRRIGRKARSKILIFVFEYRTDEEKVTLFALIIYCALFYGALIFLLQVLRDSGNVKKILDKT